MATCKKCLTVCPDEAKFCNYCGASLEARLCPNCKSQAEENAKFCNKCGYNLQETLQANGAQMQSAPVQPTAAPVYQPTATPVYQPTTAVYQPPVNSLPITQNVQPAPVYQQYVAPRSVAPKPKSKVDSANLFTLIKVWVLTGVLAILFGFSFLPVMKYTEKINGITITANINAIDIYEGAIALINPPTQEEVLSDFKDFLLEHANVLDVESGTPSEMVKEMNRLIQKFGFLKLMVTEESVESSPSMVTQILLYTVVMLALQGITLAFFITMLVTSLLYTLKSRSKTYKYGIHAVCAGIGLSLLIGLVGGTQFGAGAVLNVLLGAIGLLGIGTYSLILQGLKHQRIQILPLVSRGVAAVTALILCACIGGSAMSMSVTAGSKTIKAGYSNSFMICLIDYAAAENENSQLVGLPDIKLVESFKADMETLQQMIDAGQISAKAASEQLALVYGPHTFYNFRETDSNKTIGIITGILSLLATIAASVGISGILCVSLGEIAENKKSKRRLVWFILTLSGAGVLLVSNIINVATCSSIFKQLGLKANFLIGSGTVSTVVLATLLTISNGVLGIYSKPKNLMQAANPAMAFGGANQAAPVMQNGYAPNAIQNGYAPNAMQNGQTYYAPITQQAAPVVQAPGMQQTAVQAPIYQAAPQAPIYQAPIVQQTVRQAPIYQAPTVQQTIPQEAIYQAPIANQAPAAPQIDKVDNGVYAGSAIVSEDDKKEVKTKRIKKTEELKPEVTEKTE